MSFKPNKFFTLVLSLSVSDSELCLWTSCPRVHLSSTCFAVTCVWTWGRWGRWCPRILSSSRSCETQLRPLSQSLGTTPLPSQHSSFACQAAANEGKSALSVFLDSPEIFWDPKEPGNGLAKNPMSFDMGLNNQKWNGSWPEDMEQGVHLVMIAEHFDESLVLLGALLGLEHEDLVYLRLNARTGNSVTELDEKMRAKMRSWNVLDMLLYDFFVQVFWKKVAQFGMERLKAEVERLRTFTGDTRRKCVSRAEVPPGELEDLLCPWQTETATILGYEVQGNLSLQDQGFCIRLPELQYHSHLYFKQYCRDMRAAPAEWNLGPGGTHNHLRPGLG